MSKSSEDPSSKANRADSAQFKVLIGILIATFGTGGYQVANSQLAKTPGDVYELVKGNDERLRAIENVSARTFEMHDRYDGDGVPLWYSPRSMVDMQREMLTELRAIRTALEKQNAKTTK